MTEMVRLKSAVLGLVIDLMKSEAISPEVAKRVAGELEGVVGQPLPQERLLDIGFGGKASDD